MMEKKSKRNRKWVKHKLTHDKKLEQELLIAIDAEIFLSDEKKLKKFIQVNNKDIKRIGGYIKEVKIPVFNQVKKK